MYNDYSICFSFVPRTVDMYNGFIFQERFWSVTRRSKIAVMCALAQGILTLPFSPLNGVLSGVLTYIAGWVSSRILFASSVYRHALLLLLLLLLLL